MARGAEAARHRGTALVSESADVAYWRTLAEERGRELDALRERLRDVLVRMPEHYAAPVTGWLREPDRMEPLHELRAADVASVLDDLWTRVDADR